MNHLPNTCAYCGNPSDGDFCRESHQHAWHCKRLDLDAYENNPGLHCAPDITDRRSASPVAETVRRITPTTQQAADAIRQLGAAVRRTA